MPNYFSTNLETIRKSRNLSQNKLAEMVGVNQTTIARWENKEIAPSIDNVELLSKILHISLADLLGKDLRLKDENTLNETQVLFDKYDMLSDEDKKFISTYIEEKKKQIDREKNEEQL